MLTIWALWLSLSGMGQATGVKDENASLDQATAFCALAPDMLCRYYLDAKAQSLLVQSYDAIGCIDAPDEADCDVSEEPAYAEAMQVLAITDSHAPVSLRNFDFSSRSGSDVSAALADRLLFGADDRCFASYEYFAACAALLVDTDQFVRSYRMSLARDRKNDVAPLMAAQSTASLRFLQVALGSDDWLARVASYDDAAIKSALTVLVAHSEDPDILARMANWAEAQQRSAQDRRWLALLRDKASMLDRGTQVYGTQGSCSNGGWVTAPLQADEARTDRMRATMSLPPLSEYRRELQSACNE